MMKRIYWTFLAVLMITSFSGVCNAMDTIVIGTATYEGIEYNLIYENNNIYGGLVWLDFTTNDEEAWETQLNWASSLNNPGVLNYSIDPGFNVVWKGSCWRLPVVDEDQANLNGPWPDNSDIGDGTGFGWGGPDENGYHDYSFGVNMDNSEW